MYVSRQIYTFYQQRHIAIKDRIIKKEEKMKSFEGLIQEKKSVIADKRAYLKKCKTTSRDSCNHLNTQKMQIMDTITIREEEILELETKIQQIKLQECHLDSMGFSIDSVEMEIPILQKRLKEKQESIKQLELRFKNQMGRWLV